MTSRHQRHHNPQPPKPKLTADEILHLATEQLNMAELGLADLVGDDPTRRVPGLRNLIVWGRAVTNVLQKLRTPAGDEFDAWYEPRQAAMEGDELMRYFYRLRSEILKAGETPTVSSAVHLQNLDTDEIEALRKNAPPGAGVFFMGGPGGGSGWIVTLPDGTKERYYVTLPDDMPVDISLHVDTPPKEHLGEQLSDTSLEAIGTHYVAFLRGMLSEARDTFGGD